ncbi:succinylglutamate desuccinylase/aspartoacylase family protein [Oricola sp.]|uniref:succinylglutamate desuccinylase/aspartoacylase family protein n=1 Tax=Oricola sp. TaxID=1979950 RepID=UPI0025E6D336|nr:succinylglutamate desuccinylase/aspartoacylase family protein [Oricola sp.]MCI5078409.1 succinylglutamate desuccinylase/aspartoacylase family protein [Oricola sp.]
MKKQKPFEFAGVSIEPGSRRTVDIPLGVLSNHTPVSLPVHVINGRKRGPVIFVSAAIHGDEINGVEIVRRLLHAKPVDRIAGTLLAVPIVNAIGFLNHSRYLSDRRDLNRSFPGSETGSMAARLAHTFLNMVVARCDAGIDLHSAAIHRTNLPQIRISADDPGTIRLAEAFGAPLILKSGLREGSLRQAAISRGVEIMVYEAGEGLRFDELAIRAGVTGILRVMQSLGMLGPKAVRSARTQPLFSHSSKWVRAPAGGILRAYKGTGEWVTGGDLLGIVSDPFGVNETEVRAATAGLVIGRTNLPVVNEGEALFHIASVDEAGLPAETRIGRIEAQLQSDPLFDEDEII